jgi:hypothetical protein
MTYNAKTFRHVLYDYVLMPWKRRQFITTVLLLSEQNLFG